MSFYWGILSIKTFFHMKQFHIYLKIRKKNIDTLQVQGQTIKNHSNKRIYFSILRKNSRKEEGSMTVEMAIAFPLFLFGIATILLFGQMLFVDQEVQRGMVEAARKIAVEAYPEKTIFVAKSYWKKEVDLNEINHSCIMNGVKGVHFLGSYYDETSGEVILKSRYVLQNKIPFFSFLSYESGYEIHQKVFRGYRPDLEGENDNWVYVTDTQSVYHRTRNCSYLQLKIHQVINVSEYLSGKTLYRPCELCMKKGGNTKILYITEQGKKYHCSLQCSGLKRTVHRKKESEVVGLPLCSRCGKEGRENEGSGR